MRQYLVSNLCSRLQKVYLVRGLPFRMINTSRMCLSLSLCNVAMETTGRKDTIRGAHSRSAGNTLEALVSGDTRLLFER